MTDWLRKAWLVGLVLTLWGVARAQDVIYYFDRTTRKELSYTGKIEEESPGGIKIQIRDGKDTAVKQVPGASITWVWYRDKDVDRLSYRQPFGAHESALRETRAKPRGEQFAKALSGYMKLEQTYRGNTNARRYFQFKIAEVTAQQAEEDVTKVDSAIKLLSEFKTSHPTSWQIMPALKMLARLLEESGKMDDARKSYEELADLPDAPLPLKQESAILVGKLLLRGGKYADAEKRLQKLATTLSRDDPQALFVKAYLAESQMGQNNLADVPRALGEVIKGSTDSRLRGLAHNLMGDFYRKKGQPEEAFWHYLRVDALYNEDVDEQAKALYHLTSLFDKVKKDPIRGKECATRLLDKRFSGTMYQRLMAQEMKKEK